VQDRGRARRRQGTRRPGRAPGPQLDLLALLACAFLSVLAAAQPHAGHPAEDSLLDIMYIIGTQPAGEADPSVRARQAGLRSAASETTRWLRQIRGVSISGTRRSAALSWKVVAKPDVSARLADLAGTRVEWVLGHVSKRDKEVRPRPRDVRHTLAVVRLRQGRPSDVRRLCADALAAGLDRDDRASVLATVAMAKNQLGFPASARQVLNEALALDPSAELVPEAVSALSDGATACRTSHLA
jgi:hypothetical protein